MVTSYPIAKWEVHLKAIDATLPKLIAADSKICYYVDVSQTCYPEAISDLLGLPDSTSWTATDANCAKVLEEQRAYLESVAARLFGPAITSAAAAKVTDFELLAQSWVLRVGHHALVNEHSTFLSAINGIVKWKTVHCNSSNLLYDTSSLTSGLVGPVECNILDNAYVPPPDCTNASCTPEEGVRCYAIDNAANTYSACTHARRDAIRDFCSVPGCLLPEECCIYNTVYSCCPP